MSVILLEFFYWKPKKLLYPLLVCHSAAVIIGARCPPMDGICYVAPTAFQRVRAEVLDLHLLRRTNGSLQGGGN